MNQWIKIKLKSRIALFKYFQPESYDIFKYMSFRNMQFIWIVNRNVDLSKYYTISKDIVQSILFYKIVCNKKKKPELKKMVLLFILNYLNLSQSLFVFLQP